MCSVLAVGNAIWEVREGSVFTVFLPRDEGLDAALSSFLSFWSYVIILNTVVPISLYVRYVPEIRKQQKSLVHWCVPECLTLVHVCVCRQCGDHPSREQLLHRLGQEDVLPQEWHSCPGEDHHAQRGAGPDQIHLQWQDRHPDAEHHDFQQVLHQCKSLRWAAAYMKRVEGHSELNGHTSKGWTDFGVCFSIVQGICLTLLDKGWK